MNIINPYRFGGGFLPTDITGLDLWLDASDNSTVLDATDTAAADDEAVKTWQDKSGNANHAVQSTAANQPFRRAAEVNGMDALDFVGSDWMNGTSDLPTRQTEAKTFFFVCKPDTGTGLSDGGLIANMYVTGGATGTGGNVTCEIGYRTNDRTWISSTPCSTSSANIVTLSQSGSGQIQEVISMWLDGASVTRTSGANGSIVDNAGGYRIGASDNTALDFDGRICEVIAYDSELSTTDREAVETYLADKWGITLS